MCEPTPEEAARWHVEALFVCDPRGRTRYEREPGYAEPNLNPAPRFFLHRAPSGNTWRLGADLPASLAAELEALCRTEPVLPFPPGEADVPRSQEGVMAALERHAPVQHIHRGPTWWLPVPADQQSTAQRVTSATAVALLEPHFSARLHSPAGWERGGLSASVENGVAVALCFCARLIEPAAEAGVQTVEAYWGRGHARSAVASWAELMRSQGRLPLYSTSWDNMASRRVAAALGGVAYGEDWSIT